MGILLLKKESKLKKDGDNNKRKTRCKSLLLTSSRFFLVFVLITTWVFSGWPQIWPLGEFGINTNRIPPEIQEAKADVAYYDPISDVLDGWNCVGDGCTTGNYAVLDDGIREPNVPDTSDYIHQQFTDGFIDEHQLDEVTENGINNVTLWAYVATGDRHQMDISFRNGGTEVGSILVSPNTSASWVSTTWNSPSNIGSLTGEFTSTRGGGGGPTEGYVYAWYLEVDYTPPPEISISIDPTAFDYGLMETTENKRATAVGGVDQIRVTNNSNVAVDLDIKGADTSSTDPIWTLAATVGEDQYMHEFSNDTTDFTAPTALSTTDAVLTTNVAISGTHDFDLKIYTPSSLSGSPTGAEHTVPVTVTASEYTGS